MPNYSKQTLARIGRLLNPGKAGHLKKLAEFGGLRRKAMYNWTVAATDPQYREMPDTAKRMVAMLAYFGAAGLLNERRLEEIKALEAALEQEHETQALLRRMAARSKLASRPTTEGDATPAADTPA